MWSSSFLLFKKSEQFHPVGWNESSLANVHKQMGKEQKEKDLDLGKKREFVVLSG